jgi:hypothetical protein
MRLAVYEFLFIQLDPIFIDAKKRQLRLKAGTLNHLDRRRAPERLEYPRLSAAFLRTCRQIAAEGAPILYGNNQFVLGRKSTPAHSYLTTHTRLADLMHVSRIRPPVELVQR